MNVDKVVEGYIECALWSDRADDGESFDSEGFTEDDLTPGAVASISEDCTNFCNDNEADLEGLDPSQVGHDFCLTRNHHGAGFWDRGLGARGDRLTAACQPYGSSHLYVTEEGQVGVE